MADAAVLQLCPGELAFSVVLVIKLAEAAEAAAAWDVLSLGEDAEWSTKSVSKF